MKWGMGEVKVNAKPERLSVMGKRYQDLGKVTKRLLKSYGIKARKKLSQHFIVDDKLLDEVLGHVARLKPVNVIEIGTGLGLLTASLGDIVKYVATVELDGRLATVAKDFIYEEVGNAVDLVVGDGVLLLRSGLRSVDTVVSNVPYGITGPLIDSVIKSNCRAAVLTLQKEVAERLAASPGDRGYSRLTVMVNTFMKVELGGLYPPTSFVPKPKVDSMVVVLNRYRNWSDCWRGYEDLVRCLFNQRRKMARKVLRGCIDGGVSAEHLAILDSLVGSRRVYQLEVETLLDIYSTLYRRSI